VQSQLGAKRRVSVGYVDDHTMVMQSLLHMLDSSAPDLEVLGGAKTVQGLKETPAWGADVVLLDLGLADGVPIEDNMRRLLEAGSRVVVVSASGTSPMVQWAFSLCASAYVHKNSDVAELIGAIYAAGTGDEHYMTPSLAQTLVDAPVQHRPKFSPREAEVLHLYANGMAAKQVATRLRIGMDTVKDHVDAIREKCRAAGRPADTKVDLYKLGTEDHYF
jgi:DNA-binding NarL/FixJ family response regulator